MTMTSRTQLRDNLANLLGWEKLYPSSIQEAWRHRDGKRVIGHPTPETVDGLLKAWPREHPLAITIYEKYCVVVMNYKGEHIEFTNDHVYDTLLCALVDLIERRQNDES